MPRNLRVASAALVVLFADAANASCGAAFCNVNTNWSLQGVWTQPGPHLDLRFEYIDQDQPMNGSRRIAVGEIPAHHDEVRTINRNLLTTFDYGFNANWGVTVVVPVVDRSHEHIHNHRGAQLIETWNFTELGDMRIQGRYQTYFGEITADRAGFAGATLGLVLPTGATNITNGEGAVAERSLQPGTGTTQLALSAYYRQALPIYNSSWYAQAGLQLPLNYYQDYKPGNAYALDLGYRYDVNDRLGLNLQLNYVYKDRDKGAEAEPNDSGGQTLSLSPGVTYAVTPSVQVYGFVAAPLYRYVNGVQLTADWSAAAGVSMQF
jgi:Putative MetA-pathway of phenol degradation